MTGHALNPAFLAIIRLLALQAVRGHLTPQPQQPRAFEAKRSNRAVQSAPTKR
jgi:hypothetical protein